jgi:hypothetical protein
MTGGAFGPRKDKCIHDHSLEDAYVYNQEKNGKTYTIRECRTCRRLRNTKFKDRKRKNKPNRLKGERRVVIPETLLDCGHESLFRPMPKVGDILWCSTCKHYRVRVRRKDPA